MCRSIELKEALALHRSKFTPPLRSEDVAGGAFRERAKLHQTAINSAPIVPEGEAVPR